LREINEIMSNIVQKVMEHLKSNGTKYSKHPLFSVSDEEFSYWKCNNIDDNKWNCSDGRQILNSLCEILSELNFHEIKCCETNILQYSIYNI